MPELPDLHVISNNLNKLYTGKILTNLEIVNTKKLNTEIITYKKSFVGSKLNSISRYGKELLMKFDSDHMLALHLMREGKLFTTYEGVKHIIIKLEFNNSDILIMNDFMGQAKATLDPILSTTPDPFDAHFTINYLKQQINNKKRSTIKGFLINQKNILGIGNAYADEILWETKLSPKTKCGSIPEDVLSDLYTNIKTVLEMAAVKIKEKAPDIISGEIRDFLKVHNKNSTTSPTGFEIHNEKISGKSTYFTDEQIMYE